MPKTNKDGSPKQSELPSTLVRSEEKAQRTYAHTHDSAVETYGEGERAARTAFSALKHTHEKVGDHWEPKEEYGPSDDHAAEGLASPEPTAEGVRSRRRRGSTRARASSTSTTWRSGSTSRAGRG